MSRRTTHFDYIAALDGSFGAHVRVEQPYDVLLASSGRFRKVFPDNVGRRKSSVRWKLNENEV